MITSPRRLAGIVLTSVACCLTAGASASAQCCLTDLFSGCLSCCRKPQAFAVAPVAPVAAPIVAPVAAPVMPPPPPQPVMVPVQQTSYVPETTYRTEYKCVPVTTYQPSCEIDPCTGCSVECMQPVTQYVQKPVSVPVTQYRAVTTTKYVQMQPGYQPAAGAVGVPPAAGPAASPFSAVQTTPQAWAAAGADVSRSPLPGVAAPTLPAGAAPAYQYQQPAAPAITPQQGTYAPSQAQRPQTYPSQTYQSQPSQPQSYQPYQPQPYQAQLAQPGSQQLQVQDPQQSAAQQSRSQVQPSQESPLQPVTPPPSLKPIPELPRSGGSRDAAASAGQQLAPPQSGQDTDGGVPPRSGGSASGIQADDANGMPVVPGTGPGAATGAFPRLLEPTSHTTSWRPSDAAPARVQYPTAALPARWQGQR
ncbi:MAG: hypothetical protein O3C39_08230 [Planctomycetota bacterium]|jgi:hypothetical protein|nr:hypothetical protein [Planctomycetota bacterium]MDA1201658.1 hypothetical protein [Planctomycetota bacterium]